jgi:hypothetical protein
MYQSVKEELAKHLPSHYAKDVPSKDGFVFDPDKWTFTNKETERVVHGGQ